MSNAASPAPTDGHEVHEGPIKTPKQLIAAVVAAFVVPIIIIILLANFVNLGGRAGAGSQGLSDEAVASRLQPVGRIQIKEAADPNVVRSGEQVFQAQCSACHATGAAGAPKVGDTAAWGPRIATGFQALVTSALKGKNAMPPQGGGDFNETEIARGVAYMANQGGAKFEEPKPPAAAASK